MKIDMYSHLTVKDLLKFTAPSIAMMIFSSVYYIIDGLFVANFVGTTGLAAVNLIMPFIMILGTGILLTVRTRVLQVRKFGESMSSTIVPAVKDMKKSKKVRDKTLTL